MFIRATINSTTGRAIILEWPGEKTMPAKREFDTPAVMIEVIPVNNRTVEIRAITRKEL